MKKVNFTPIIERVAAYLIDILVVTIISTLISYIPPLNNRNEEYKELYAEYTEFHNEYVELTKLLDNIKDSEKITEEEYKQFTDVERYKEYFEEKYEDKLLSKEEFKEIKDKINKKYLDVSADYEYEIQKIGIPSSVVTIICLFLYFVVLQCILKGKTVGKYILGLRVVSSNDKKLNILTYFIRGLIVNNILFNSINITLLSLTEKATYLKADNVISYVVTVVEAAIIFLIFTREDRRGLHDLICHTKVIKENKKD